MNKSEVLWGCVCLVVVGAAGWGYYWDTPVQQAKRMAAEHAKDPPSVQFRDIEVCRASGQIDHVRGSMNAKNSYGAYVGFRGFVVSFIGGRASSFYGEDSHISSTMSLIEIEESMKTHRGEMKAEDKTPCYEVFAKARGF